MINPAIFNTQKSDYENTPIILGQPRGLFDTIGDQYPKQTALYEKLRGQDWTEKEFQFASCKIDFMRADPRPANRMIRNLGYQWHTDSTAASTIAGIMACVTSSTRVWTGYQRISDNESVHALTYGDIVAISFSDDARAALEKFKNEIDSIERLEVVAKVFETAFVAAHRWALHQAKPHLYPLTEREKYETYDAIFMYIVALLVMERVQFTSSFLETFAINRSENMFIPIGDAVQRIAQDELEIHVPFGAANIVSLMSTDRGREAYKNNRHLIAAMINEAVRSEAKWVEIGAEDGYELEDATAAKSLEFAQFGGTDVATFMSVRDEVNFRLIDTNPIPWIEKRVNLSALQASPQEAPATSYMVNAVVDDTKGKKIAFTL